MIYSVIVDISHSQVDKVFDYSAPFDAPVGSRVLVPFGFRTIEGYVIGTKETTDRETKDIIKILDGYTVILPEMLAMAEYLKEQNLRYIDSLRLFIPSKLRGGRVKVLNRNFIYLNPEADADGFIKTLPKNAKKQGLLIERLKRGGEYETDVLKEYSASSVAALIEKGIIIKTNAEKERIPEGLECEKKEIRLTAEQSGAVEQILNGGKLFHLLHGVTGSGKTEIYMNVIERVLQEGKTAVMLVPEISLTPQMLGVFRNRFGDSVSMLHSGLSDGERYDEWRKLRLGKAKIALGARSAIFAPLQNLGVIIMDEEHDSSYASETHPRYFTSEIAEFRAKYNGAKLIFGSATPSIESYLKAKKGEYGLITLTNRVNFREMPDIEVVDMRKELREGNTSIFGKRLLSALDETLKSGNQSMVFLNRRGYASFIRCRSCGYVAKCTDCDVSLTYHKEEDLLKCHYCGNKYTMPSKCPKCGFEHLKEGKTGTERVVSELQRIFPKARIVRMDNDTTNTKNAYVNILTAFSEGRYDILVGTQMIAKGHDFKNVTTVGILDADQALYFSDYRSNERTFQLITQVSGRAGREQKAGRVIMQTYNPNHYVFRFASNYDYRGFFDKEVNSRETCKFPPFTKLVRVMVLGKDEQKTVTRAREVYIKLRDLKTENPDKIIRVQGMRAPIKMIETFHRYQLVLWLNIEREKEIMQDIYRISAEAEDKDINVNTEINPQHIY